MFSPPLPVATSAIFLKQTFSPLAYLTIVAVIAGFGMSFLTELDFDSNVSSKF